MKKVCELCHGEGWVCENHPATPFEGGNKMCCGGAGQPCKCNPLAEVKWKEVISQKGKVIQ